MVSSSRLGTALHIEVRSRRSTVAAFASVVVGGLALATGAPPLALWTLPLMAPAWLAWSLERAVSARRPVRRALALGLVMGLACNAAATHWVLGLLERFGGFPFAAALPTAILLWTAQGAIIALAGAGAVALVRRGSPLWGVLPPCLALAYSITPALFPWRPSVTQLHWLPWVQLAEVGGEPLLDLLWASAGCALFEWLRRPRRGPAVVFALALLGPALYGTVRLPQVEAERDRAPSLRVGIVQPNVSIREKHDPARWRDQLKRLRAMTRELEAAGAELVLWPETAYPYRWHRERMRDTPPPRSVLADGVRGPVLLGTITAGGSCERWNSVLALDEDGRVRGIADKVRLLAFGEFVPLWHWLPPLQERFRCPGLLEGTHPIALSIAGARVGVLNCYEDTLGAMAWQVMQQGPNLLANVTNDAWFGDTNEPHIHHLLARMRSVESRRDLVRAVNTGVSGHIAATGAEHARTRTFVQRSILAEARLLTGSTPWTRFGDWVTPLLAGALLGIGLALRMRRRR